MVDLHITFLKPFGSYFIRCQSSIQKALFFLRKEIDLPYVEHWNKLRFENIINKQEDIFGNEVFRDVKED